MEEKNIGKDFLDLLTDAKRNPEKYQAIKSCKSLPEVYSFIKRIHPEYTFTEEELGKFVLRSAKIPDHELNVSGGVDPGIAKISSQLGTVGYFTKFGSKFVDLFGDMLFAEEEMNPLEIQQKVVDMMQNTKSGEAYQSDDMYSVEDSMETLKKMDKRQFSNLLELSEMNSNSLKKLSKSKNILNGSFEKYANKYKPSE